ncbi:GntR family transcriptional regulator [Nesterenkonia alba]|uniref:GntR family transcriptional regulator n=1 Tax=Nesterenkonia alba TaxID=515814 RepID=UPI00146C379A|nr:GntR family transcriptional regulator [Nesterenkonia alba]
MYTSVSTHRHNEPMDDAPAVGAGGGSATDRVYAGLRNDIRAGRVYPWDRLTEKTIGAHFGVSRTPVREALARLVAEGLLQRNADGVGLVLPDADTIGGLYEARLAIELQGIRRVAAGAASYDLQILDDLEQTWEQVLTDPPEIEPSLTSWDEAFHRGVLAAAGEPALVDVLGHINDRIRALRMYGYIAPEQLASSAAGHLRVIQALKNQRYDDGEEALTEHIVSTRNDSLARALHGAQAPGFARPRRLPHQDT